MSAHPYRIVRCDRAGFWNVVDTDDGHKIIGTSHPSRARAREALADLREDYIDYTRLDCPTCGDESCPAAIDADGCGQDGTDGPTGPCPHADADRTDDDRRQRWWPDPDAA